MKSLIAIFFLTELCDLYRLKQSGSFLGNEGGNEGSESSSSDDKTYLYKGSKKDYCEKFSVNYEYYCKGPADPFSASKGQIKSGGDSDFPDIEHPTTSRKSSSRRKKLKKRPCSADCDERIFPHCTKECKCDYDYPAVQKFCNPPPLPMFLNTCRLWYYGCPKYEQYHYASQFIYSKAEKGKVLEGPKQSTTFQLLAPSGETLPYKPAHQRVKREMVDWPEAPGEIKFSGNETVDFEFGIDAENNNQTVSMDKMVKLKNGTMIELVAAPPLPKNKSSRDQVLKETKAPPELPRIKKTTGGEAVPVYSDSVFSNALAQYNSLTDSRGILHRPRSRSPFTKPGLWEPNPDDPHNRDHANKYYYRPESVSVDWLQGQLAWGAHWAVPAAGVGGTDGFSAVHFPSIGTFLNIPDDYD
uniref:WAP domain-containing protein n=1 Tax=Caenorhabditis tropicalis TaxID=1561998 RepID=A0A1I7UJU9_9PELO